MLDVTHLSHTTSPASLITLMLMLPVKELRIDTHTNECYQQALQLMLFRCRTVTGTVEKLEVSSGNDTKDCVLFVYAFNSLKKLTIRLHELHDVLNIVDFKVFATKFGHEFCLLKVGEDGEEVACTNLYFATTVQRRSIANSAVNQNAAELRDFDLD